MTQNQQSPSPDPAVQELWETVYGAPPGRTAAPLGPNTQIQTSSGSSVALNPPSVGGKSLSRGGMVWNVLDYGAVADGGTDANCSMTAGSAVLTSTTSPGPFKPSMVGMTIGVPNAQNNAAPTGKTMIASIIGFTDSQNVTLSKTADTNTIGGATLSGATSWGTDNRLAFQACINDAGVAGGVTLVPYTGTGMYFMTYSGNAVGNWGGGFGGYPALTILSNVILLGTGPKVPFLLTPDQYYNGTTVIGDQGLGATPNWSVRGLGFNGSHVMQTYGTGSYEVSSWGIFNTSNNVVIANCEFTAFGSKCSYNWGNSGLGGLVGFWFVNNYIHDSPGNLIDVDTAHDFFIIDNLFLRNGVQGGVNSLLNHSTTPTDTTRGLIARNIWDNCTLLWQIAAMSDVAVEDNYMVAAPNSAFAVSWNQGGGHGGPRRILFSGNFIDGGSTMTQGGGNANLLVFVDCSDVIITNNWLVAWPLAYSGSAPPDRNYGNGIGAAVGSLGYTNFVISNNRIVNNGIAVNGSGAVNVAQVAITGNIVDGLIYIGGAGAVNQGTITGNIAGLILSGQPTYFHQISGSDWTATGNYLSAEGGTSGVLNVSGGFRSVIGNRIHCFNAALAGSQKIISNNGTNPGVRYIANIFSVAGNATLNNTFGAWDVVKDNYGWNPRGKQNPPALGGSGVAVANAFNSSAEFYLSGGTVTAVAIGLVTPANLPFVASGTGGTLLHSTQYFYRVSITNAAGETLASIETSITTPANGNVDTCSVLVKWIPSPGGTGAKVYGRSTGAELLMATLNGGATSWLDDGSVTPAGALPAANTTGTATGLIAGTFPLEPQQALIPTYSVAPTLVTIVH